MFLFPCVSVWVTVFSFIWKEGLETDNLSQTVHSTTFMSLQKNAMWEISTFRKIITNILYKTWKSHGEWMLQSSLGKSAMPVLG
jgi:hypothetical protein